MNIIQALRTLSGLTSAESVLTSAPPKPPAGLSLFAIVEESDENPRLQFLGNSSTNNALITVSLFAPPRALDGLPADAVALLDLYNQVMKPAFRNLVTDDITPGLSQNHPFQFVSGAPPRFDRFYGGRTANVRFRIVRQRQ